MKLKTVVARDIMSEVVVVIDEGGLIKDAVHLMLRDRIHGLPVVNARKNIIGIVTLADYFKLIDKIMKDENSDFLEEILECKDFKISDIMTKDVFSIPPETPLDEMIRIAASRKIHTFPVIENDKLIGIVGRHDILNAVFNFS